MAKAMLALAVLLAFGARAWAEPFIVGYIYQGPKVDAGWYASQDSGRLYVQEHMPDVRIMVAENIPETADSERLMQRMVHSGARLIFATSYGYFDKAVRVAKQYPGVIFMHSGDGQTAYHVGNYFGSTEEAMYVAGIAAGYKTASNKLGFVAAHPIPVILRAINAFALGARSVNPKATVQVIFLDIWKDPTREAEAANSLIDQGIDVLGEEVDSTLTMAQVCEKRGISFVGQYYDASSVAPHAWLIGSYYYWGPMMVDIIKQVQEGTWKQRAIAATLASGQVRLTPYGPGMPEVAKPVLERVTAEFTSGSRKLWSGPVRAQDGSIVIPAGTLLPPEKVTAMNFFVEGVVGALPK